MQQENSFMNCYPNEIKTVRGRYVFNKKEISEDNIVLCSLDSFTPYFSDNTRIRIQGANKQWEMMFFCHQSNNLYVFLSAGGRKEGDLYPQFQRISWHKYVNGDCLYVEDPMYKTYDELATGWFFGDKDEFLLLELKQIIEKFICEKKYDKVFIIGSSCGGYASCILSGLINNTYAIAMNPQIDLNIWGYYSNFKQICNFHSPDLYGRENILHFFDSNSNFFISVNASSSNDMRQISLLENKLNTKFKYGYNYHRNIVVHIYSADDNFANPHTAFYGVFEFNIFLNIAMSYFENSKEDYSTPILLNESFYEKQKVRQERNFTTYWNNLLKKITINNKISLHPRLSQNFIKFDFIDPKVKELFAFQLVFNNKKLFIRLESAGKFDYADYIKSKGIHIENIVRKEQLNAYNILTTEDEVECSFSSFVDMVYEMAMLFNRS